MPSDPSPLEDFFPEETPERLNGIALRMQKAIEELFAVRAEAAEFSKSTKLPDEVERVLTASTHCDVVGAPSTPAENDSTSVDRRLYLPTPEGWEIKIHSGPRDYCYYRNPGEEWFHLLIDGELYLEYGNERICLNCACRQGILVEDRLYWQMGRRRPRKQFLAEEASETPTIGELHQENDSPATLENVGRVHEKQS